MASNLNIMECLRELEQNKKPMHELPGKSLDWLREHNLVIFDNKGATVTDLGREILERAKDKKLNW